MAGCGCFSKIYLQTQENSLWGIVWWTPNLKSVLVTALYLFCLYFGSLTLWLDFQILWSSTGTEPSRDFCHLQFQQRPFQLLLIHHYHLLRTHSQGLGTMGRERHLVWKFSWRFSKDTAHLFGFTKALASRNIGVKASLLILAPRFSPGL